MKPIPLIAVLLLLAIAPAFAQTDKPASPEKPKVATNEKWVITGKGPTSINLKTRKSIFRDSVHLNALPQFELDCDQLTSTMDGTDKRKFETIEAERNVLISIHEVKDGKQTTRRATADKAVYHLSTDTVTLTGNAKFEDESGVFSAEVIHYNRTTGDMTSEGAYKLEGKGRLDKKP